MSRSGLAKKCAVDVDFVLETVNIMFESHGSELHTDALIHSDQGVHYKNHSFREIISNHELRQSMSRKANCWDNAPQESLFGHMKYEIHILPSDGHADITTKVDDWIDYYNNERYQWSLAKLSPSEYYRYVTVGVPYGDLFFDPPSRFVVYHSYIVAVGCIVIIFKRL